MHGEDCYESRLQVETGKFAGKMCCLGFISIACGYTSNEILGISSPSKLMYNTVNTVNTINTTVFNKLAVEETEMMNINDEHIVTEVNRESKLIKLAAKVGVELVFVN
jgi:hypothetical protein